MPADPVDRLQNPPGRPGGDQVIMRHG